METMDNDKRFLEGSYAPVQNGQTVPDWTGAGASDSCGRSCVGVGIKPTPSATFRNGVSVPEWSGRFAGRNGASERECSATEHNDICSIRHIVLSGGMIYGFAFYGALRELNKKGIWNLQELKTIYSTSVGCIIATTISLNYDWDVLDKFIIDRPWHNCFKFSLHSVMNCFQNNGIFKIDTIEEVLYPLLSGKDIPMTVTLKEFYEITKIENHYFTVNLNTFQLIDVSYLTHPDWKLVEAIYASCCAPIFFQPLKKDGTIYTDGGLLSNYPIHQLFESSDEVNESEVLGLHTVATETILKTKMENSNTLYDYIYSIFAKVMQHLSNKKVWQPRIQLDFDSTFIPVFDLYNVVNSTEQRTKLVNYGAQLCDEYAGRFN